MCKTLKLFIKNHDTNKLNVNSFFLLLTVLGQYSRVPWFAIHEYVISEYGAYSLCMTYFYEQRRIKFELGFT